MSYANDKDLIEAILSGNQQAFAEFLQRYKNLVRHIVVRMVANPTDREDLGQEIFCKIYRHLDSFRFASKVSTWVAKIAYNACINHLQKKKIPLFADDEAAEDSTTAKQFRSFEASPVEKLEQKIDAADVHRAIEQLPCHYRTVVTLFHLQQMSYREISEIMGLPEGTVKSYLFRARKILRHKLAPLITEEAFNHESSL